MIIKYYIDSSITDAELVKVLAGLSIDDTKTLEFYIKKEEYDKIDFLRKGLDKLYGCKLNIV